VDDSFTRLTQAVRHAMGGQRPAVGPVAISERDSAALLWLAQRHRVLLHLAQATLVDAADAANSSVTAGLSGYRRNAGVKHLAAARELRLLHGALQERAVTASFASGWVMGERYYPARSLREIGDQVRVFVQPADRAAAVEALSGLGYVLGPRDPLALHTLGRSRVTLDDATEVWESARRLTLLDVQISVPGPEAWLGRVLAPRGPRPRILTLERACDVIALCDQADFDWELLWREADRIGRRLRIVAGIAASYALLDREPPPAVRAMLIGPRMGSARDFLVASSTAVVRPRPHGLAKRLRVLAPQEQPSIGRFSPTPLAVVDRMLAVAHVAPGDVVYDLGCGDGRIVQRAAEVFGATAIGVDRDPLLLAQARTEAAARGLGSRVQFVEQDVFDVDVSQATVICLYLQRFAYRKIEHWLKASAMPGTRIVSHDVGFPDWVPDSTEIVVSDGLRASFVYCWTIPSRS